MKKLPEEFINMLSELDEKDYGHLVEVITEGAAPTSIRVNGSRGADISEICNSLGTMSAGAVGWSSSGHYLTERPLFTTDPLLHQGCYYVQEASSMAVEKAVEKAIELTRREGRELRYLDACASPGGKTLCAIDVLPEGSFVVANEYDSRRAQILTENIAKWGAEVVVTRGDATTKLYPDSFFDIISVDAPCSGEGMMRKDPYAIEQWSERLVDECAHRQRLMTDRLWASLRPGGVMIYSTCTFNQRENEETVERLIREYGAEPIETDLSHYREIAGGQGKHSGLPVYRFIPGAVKGEGLFIAVLKKPGDETAGTTAKERNIKKSKRGEYKDSEEAKRYLNGKYKTVPGNAMRVIDERHVEAYEALTKEIKPIVAGIELGVVKGADFIPSQNLVLSRHYKRGTIAEYDVGRTTAIEYLRRQTIRLGEDAPRGLLLLTYSGRPLGLVKNLGNRANNLYPDGWRIKK